MDAFTPGLLHRIPPPRKIALVRASRIGDFICATPAFRALRSALPDAEISLVGLPFVEPLVQASPYLDHFIRFPGFPGMAEQFFDSGIATSFFSAMQEERFDFAIQMHGSGANSNPFTLLLGARLAAGFVRPGDPAGRLDAALPFPASGHEVDRVLALTTFLGAPTRDTHTEFPTSCEDEATADSLLQGIERPLIGIHPGARDRIKRWSPERFAMVAPQVRNSRGGTLVLLGGEEEREAAREVAIRSSIPCRDLAGRTSLGVLGAVIRRLAVLITNDSGPAHVAYALGTPAVTIFGGTSPAMWGPRDGRHQTVAHHVPCRPCELPECPIGYVCLESVTVETVVEAVNYALLKAGQGG